MENHNKKYSIDVPLETHWVAAPCSAANCGKFEKGWTIEVDLELVLLNGRSLGQQQYDYIKYQSGRQFKETRLDERRILFLFYPNQECFEQHKVKREDLEEFYTRTDARAGKLSIRELHRNTMEPEQFIDEMNEDVYQHDKDKKEG